MEKFSQFLRKVKKKKIYVAYDQVMPHVSIYLREVITYVYKRACTTMFIAPNWKQPIYFLDLFLKSYFSLWKKLKEFLHRHRVDLPSSHEEMTLQRDQMTLS